MSATTFDFTEVLSNIDLLLGGARLTVLLWVLATLAGIGVGLPIALARISGRRVLEWPAAGLVEIFRNTPVLIQLIWFYYALPVLTGIQLSAFSATLLALSLNGAAYCAEIWRQGLLGVPRGQWEAGRALGMSRGRMLRRVVLPQAVRGMLPAFTNRAIELAKNTSVASIVTVHEMMYQARLFSSQHYVPLETFSVVAVIYFLVISPFTLVSDRLERRFAAQGN